MLQSILGATRRSAVQVLLDQRQQVENTSNLHTERPTSGWLRFLSLLEMSNLSIF